MQAVQNASILHLVRCQHCKQKAQVLVTANEYWKRHGDDNFLAVSVGLSARNEGHRGDFAALSNYPSFLACWQARGMPLLGAMAVLPAQVVMTCGLIRGVSPAAGARATDCSESSAAKREAHTQVCLAKCGRLRDKCCSQPSLANSQSKPKKQALGHVHPYGGT